MKILIATVANESWSCIMSDRFRFLAASDRIGTHQLTEEAEDADVILFVDLHQFAADWQLKEFQRHPLCRRFERKIMVYDERDEPFCLFPGLYVSVTKTHFNPARQKACSYCHLKNELGELPGGEPDLLFSFQGAKSHPVRHPIFRLSHPRGLIENTSDLNFFDYSGYSQTDEYKNRVRVRQERYREVVSRSKFVLCPRGAGASSFRLFETLSAGRVPVIISDEWVPPHGPDWASCSIRVRENEVETLPSLLEAHEAEWPEMALSATRTFQEWFASDILFHRMMEECQNLLHNGILGRTSFPLRDSAFRARGWNFHKGRLRVEVGKQRRALLQKLGR